MRVHRTAGVMAVALLAAAGFAVSAGGQTGEVSQPFEFSGEPEDFVVPAGICSVTVDAFGAAGGDYLGREIPTVGGLGGRATATIPVTPGETLIVRVGGRGTDSDIPNGLTAEADGDASAADVTVAVFGPGGFNGGGDGGDTADDAGAGGGGGSDVRQGGDALENRVVVGGGGGGGGGTDNEPGIGDGGAGGGTEGDPGEDSHLGSIGGGGGTQDAGGAAGPNDATAGDGEFGVGGVGGVGGNESNDGGGGGGGGFFGGGGGEGDTPGTDDGGGGGGGSGFGPSGVAFETGVQEGDGFVTISYDPATDSCPPPAAAPAAIELVPRFTG